MQWLKSIQDHSRVLWQQIRRLSGQDAYERYLEHFYAHQAEPSANATHRPAPNGCEAADMSEEKKVLPLTKEEFYKQWQDRKWRGINRCC